AEPSLECVDLGVPDRHARGPIVHDVPCLNVVLGRASDARPWLRLDVKIVRQNAQVRVQSRHSVSMARSDNKLNVLILTAGMLDTVARHATCLVFGETANPRNTSTP